MFNDGDKINFSPQVFKIIQDKVINIVIHSFLQLLFNPLTIVMNLVSSVKVFKFINFLIK